MQKAVFSTSLSKLQPSLTLDVPLQSKVSSAEAMWAFKVAEEGFTLGDCDHNPLLFKNMFIISADGPNINKLIWRNLN